MIDILEEEPSGPALVVRFDSTRVKRPPSCERRKPFRLLAVDPGLREIGVALFEDDQLSRVAHLKNPNTTSRDALAWAAGAGAVRTWAGEIDELIVEMMVVRAGRRDVNPDDLMQLVGLAGVLVGLYDPAPARVIRPEDWKGRLKKRIHHPRILRSLNPNERALVDRYMGGRTTARYDSTAQYIEACRRCRGKEHPNDPIHNVIDAVGIGLDRLGRA